MSIYLDEKNPGKHKPFEDASPDIVEYVRYLEVIAGKSANTAFSYFCDLRGFGNAATKSPRLPGGWPVSTAFMIIWSIRSTGWIPTRPL